MTANSDENREMAHLMERDQQGDHAFDQAEKLQKKEHLPAQ
jgi:hypothetical protein